MVAPPDPRVADDPLVREAWALLRDAAAEDEALRTGASEGKSPKTSEGWG
jgi:hypothetical protein